MSWTEQTLALLTAEGFRRGGARRAVIELLGHEDCCLSAQEIFDTLRARKRRVGIATVYRVLELLSERGLVQRVELGSGTARYEAMRREAHHHHFVCEGCGKIEAFADSGLERALQRVEGSSRYEVAAHDVVLRGACRECAS